MASFNFNKVIIGGNITKDIELKKTPNGVSVVTFTVAVNKKANGEQAADFFNVTAWRKTAEFIEQYFRKGSSICVVGSLQNRKWQDKDGNNRVSTEITADEAFFVDSKGENTAPFQPASSTPSYIPTAYTDAAPQFEEISANEELPF